MLKSILAVIVGFVLWAILWVGSDAVLRIISPEWYGAELKSFSSTILLISLVRSVIISLISGYVAALIAGRSSMTTVFALGPASNGCRVLDATDAASSQLRARSRVRVISITPRAASLSVKCG